MERELHVTFSHDVVDENVVRAINMKLKKIAAANESVHEWLTYWLIIVTADSTGAGLIGFKGYPNAQGESEIGYGVAPAHHNQGYMTEALQAMCRWAFRNPDCRAVTATTVINPASQRLLKKVGAQMAGQHGDSTDWIIPRPDE